jgi:general L-amino acid transport system permease protein
MPTRATPSVPLWRDDRVWKIFFQGIVLALIFGGYALLLHNFNLNLQRTGLTFSFKFLTSPAGFSIGETLVDYSANDPYGRAIWVGILNTLKIVILGLGATTILGTIVGVASFSQNWIVRTLSQVYVEIIRNTPLLLQLLFWYFVVFLSLPRPQETLALPGAIFMNKTALRIPWPAIEGQFWFWLGTLVITLGLITVLWQWYTRQRVEQGRTEPWQWVVIALLMVGCILIVTVAFRWEFPVSPKPGVFEGGLHLSVEYSAVLIGLVVYTAAFIAEIVRGGIQSVSKGQWEAARSLGLPQGLVMRLVVLPQALRVIVPPLNSQYMNLTKNSSLALAIGYPDLFSVSSTTLNQTGRPMEVFVILMGTYLTFSLIISVVMNQINRLVQLKER